MNINVSILFQRHGRKKNTRVLNCYIGSNDSIEASKGSKTRNKIKNRHPTQQMLLTTSKGKP